MIVGNGIMAKAFSTYSDDAEIIIFASGVPNSQELRVEAFNRERALLLDTIKNNANKFLVYFSTCSMHDPASANTPYVEHKLAIENLIQERCLKYNIFRVSQVVARATNKTLVKYLYDRICACKKFNVWKNSDRNLIDIDDVYFFVNSVIEQKVNQNQVINVANPMSMSIISIVEMMEDIIGKKAHYQLLDRGDKYKKINLNVMKNVFKDDFSIFNDNYYRTILEKYYGSSR